MDISDEEMRWMDLDLRGDSLAHDEAVLWDSALADPVRCNRQLVILISVALN